MSRCLQAREVTIALRFRRGEPKPKRFTLVVPAHWTKAALLRYVRAEHPDETARIVQWNPSADGWEPRIWMPNPTGFRDYIHGLAPHESVRHMTYEGEG
jgi:hypothetical protein